MQEIELKPCPFCGSEAKVIKFSKCNKPYVVICENDFCLASVGNYSSKREYAIEAWNRRI